MRQTEPTFLHAPDGTPLAVYDWPLAPGAAARATVLIVHGMGEHAGRYAALAQRRRERWQRLASRLRVPLLPLNTASDLVDQLRNQLHGAGSA